jgi:hypothetical protein
MRRRIFAHNLLAQERRGGIIWKILLGIVLLVFVLVGSGFGYLYYKVKNSPGLYAMTMFGAKVFALPEFQQRSGESTNPEERTGLALSLARQGMHRLDDRTVLHVARIKGKLLAAADSGECATIARNTDLAAIAKGAPFALARLDSASLVDWADIAYRAVLAELKQHPPQQPGEREVTDAMVALMRSLPESQRARLATGLAASPETSDGDVCWAARTMYRKLVQMDQPSRYVLARAVLPDP